MIILRHILLSCLILFSVACGQKTSLQPLDSTATILAFGDSLTYGTGTNRESSYPAVLQEITGLTVINEGIPGNTTEDGLQRIDKALTEHSPALVLLCLGGNDFLHKHPRQFTRDNLVSLVNTIRQSGSQVVLIAVPELGLFINDAELYADIAKQLQIPLLEDVLSDYLSDRTLKSDAIHLNTEGYHRLAESIKQFLIAQGALVE
jgi:acyl-CoA thioesterase-1